MCLIKMKFTPPQLFSKLIHKVFKIGLVTLPLLCIFYNCISQNTNTSYNLNSNLITGNFNTAIGVNTFFSNTSGNANTAIGGNSLSFNTTGSSNTANGHFSLNNNTTGDANTSIGQNSLSKNTIGSYNVAVGQSSLFFNSSGNFNTCIGQASLSTNTTGSYNVANGTGSLFNNITGNNNAANGYYSLVNNTTGNNNAANGYNSLVNNTTGSSNTAFGSYSLLNNITGSNNTALGNFARVGAGNLNNATAIGAGATVNNSNSIQLGNSFVTEIYAGTGKNATVIAGGLKITGGVLGTGKVLTSDANGVATWQVPAGGSTNLWGLSGNVGTIDGTNFIGTTDNVPLNFKVNNLKAGRLDPILRNSFWGIEAGANNITGTNNTAIGSSSLQKNTTGTFNNSMGVSSLFNNSTGQFNSASGAFSLFGNITGNYNTAKGSFALYYNNDGQYNTAFGSSSLQQNVSGNNNTGLGSFANVGSGNLNNATAVGYGAIVNASNSMQFGNSDVTEIYAGTGTNATVIAGGLKITGGVLGAGKVLTSDANGVATWQAPTGGGSTNFWGLTGNAGTVDGTNFIGTIDNAPFEIRVNSQRAGKVDPLSTNTSFGLEAGINLSSSSGQFNTALGFEAFRDNDLGSSNTAIGTQAILLNRIGRNNSAVGSGALLQNNGDKNTAMGTGSLSSNTVGKRNSGFGAEADVLLNSTFNNSTAIGFQAIVNVGDKIRLGDATVTAVEGPVVYTPSDMRFKNNIVENDVIGLKFINLLRPVVYNFDTRKFQEFLIQDLPENEKEKYLEKDFAPSTTIRQSGFIAQEVEEAAAEVGYNFNGIHKPENKFDNYSLAYSQFVVPLVKAVQELSEQNQALKQSNDVQAKANELLKKDMAELRSIVLALKNNNVEGSIKITENSNEAKLYQNVPNPFSKTTTIRYNIPANTKRAAITITTIDGIKVKTFELNSKGGQTLDISGGQLNAGTYIYTLEVDGVVVDSKKMILTK
jgi:trimeric autotransporter adhesin